ncbi:BA75_03292T0 [Komagataella pastoris]|uniref:BA75_03292T0 n=1 Tax=Komagataella pastoris TaxID=4922 RepID=A0A1B2JCL1_PICPA|nr:BA75_03292T0 [Komagataella pastoris]
MGDSHSKQRRKRSRTPLPTADVDEYFIESQEKPSCVPAVAGKGKDKRRKKLELHRELDAWALIDELDTFQGSQDSQRATLFSNDANSIDLPSIVTSDGDEPIDLANLNESFNEAFEPAQQKSITGNDKTVHSHIQYQDSLRTYSSTRSFLEDDENETNDIHQQTSEADRRDTIQDINDLRNLGVSNKIKDEYQFMLESFETADESLLQVTLFDLLQKLQTDQKMLNYFHHVGFPKSLLECVHLKNDLVSKLIFASIIIFMSSQDLSMTSILKSVPNINEFLIFSNAYSWPDNCSRMKKKLLLDFQKTLHKLIGASSLTTITLHLLLSLAKTNSLCLLEQASLLQLDQAILHSIKERDFELLNLELTILESLITNPVSTMSLFTSIEPLVELLFANKSHHQLSKQCKTLFSSITAIGVIYTKSITEDDKLYKTFLSSKAVQSLLSTVHSSHVLSNPSSVQSKDVQLYTWGCFSLGWLLNISKFPRCFECVDQYSVAIINSVLESMNSSVDLNIGYISMFIGRLYQANVLAYSPDSPILHNLRTFKKLITVNSLNEHADLIIKDLERRDY